MGVQKIHEDDPSRDVIHFDGDLIFKKETLQRLVDVRKNTVVVDTFNKTDEESMDAEIDENFNCTLLSKKATKGVGEFIGMSRIQHDAIDTLLPVLDRCPPKS